ncbi:hypothetical protein TSAR_000267 [Trichomalopsis sarcophagae]|uniref:Uncharacterized protein n=1 Tax=Trichomalopsis sarcophagae TaxID=543379 RepID=A0A232EJU8_9HYME|nr:hypothetical protein TSAR_000267 [Trichomalopsis sarcophagae]
MADYPPNEMVDMIMILGECRGVYVCAAALDAERYPNRRHPTYITIRDLTNIAREGRLHRERRRHEYGENDNRVLLTLVLEKSKDNMEYQNQEFLGSSKPRDVNPLWHRTVDNQHRWSLNVWCGIVNGYVIGPYFFNGNFNQPNFLEFLRAHLPGLLEDIDLETRQRMWVQLDRAPPYFARIVRTFFNERYTNQWIGRGGPVAWPPNSPDLTSPDFYL